jgi:hypothetical protein
MRTENLEIFTNEDKLMAALDRVLTAENYDAESEQVPEKHSIDQWSLSEVVSGEDRVSLAAVCALSGSKMNGEKLFEGERLSLIDEEDFSIRLKVEGRQACYKDKDGNLLNTNVKVEGCIGPDEKPVKGDVVRIKRGQLTKDPITKKKMTQAIKRRLIAAGSDIYTYATARVDADGCITVSIADAIYLLQTFSRFSLRPQICNVRPKEKEKGIFKAEKLNWLFTEVPADYRDPSRKGPKPKSFEDK